MELNELKCLSMIPQQTMFCSFQGFSLFEIFFNNKKVLEQIDKMLDDWQASVEMGQSADDSQAERKILFVLQTHELEKQDAFEIKVNT